MVPGDGSGGGLLGGGVHSGAAVDEATAKTKTPTSFGLKPRKQPNCCEFAIFALVCFVCTFDTIVHCAPSVLFPTPIEPSWPHTQVVNISRASHAVASRCLQYH